MRKNGLLHLLIAFMASLSMAAPTAPLGGALDKKALRQIYIDGDFEVLKKQLETYLRNPTSRPLREDSIFAFKYLGVMAAADSNTLVLG